MKNTTFLITGGAGFIGSNIAKSLIDQGYSCVVLDNLSTSSYDNIKALDYNANFKFIEGSITDYDTCAQAMKKVDKVFHLAALGSVPRSINKPLATNGVNVTGFLNVIHAAKENNIQRIVFSSSSSVYGDDEHLPKREEVVGKPLSPYAVSKITNELYGLNYSEIYNVEVIGLRYFNVFGPNQDPGGPYAAVIPVFIENLLEGKTCNINGDGTITRDFTYVDNVVQANLKAAFTENPEALNKIYNVAYGETTSLIDLYEMITEEINVNQKPNFGEERKGDIKNSLADITLAKTYLNFTPKIDVKQGIKLTIDWFKKKKRQL